MLTASKWLLIIAGVLLIIDSILMFGGKPSPFFGWLGDRTPKRYLGYLCAAGLNPYNVGTPTYKKKTNLK